MKQKKLNEKLRLAALALAGKSFPKSPSTRALFEFCRDLPVFSRKKDKFFNESKTSAFIVQELLPLNTFHVIDRMCPKLKLAITLSRIGAHFRNFENESKVYRDVLHLLEEAETFQRENGGMTNTNEKEAKIVSYNFADEVVESQEWVQCDVCNRWREVPKNVTLQSNADWRCNMATWTTFSCIDNCNADVIATKTPFEEKSELSVKKKRKRSDRRRRDAVEKGGEIVAIKDAAHMPSRTIQVKRKKSVSSPSSHTKREYVNILVPAEAMPNSMLQFSYGGKTFSVPVPDELELKRTNRLLKVDVETCAPRKSTVSKKKKRKSKRKIVSEVINQSENNNTKSSMEEDEGMYIEREVLRCLADPTFPCFIAHVGGIIQRVKQNAISVLDSGFKGSWSDHNQQSVSQNTANMTKKEIKNVEKKNDEGDVYNDENLLCRSPELIRVSPP